MSTDDQPGRAVKPGKYFYRLTQLTERNNRLLASFFWFVPECTWIDPIYQRLSQQPGQGSPAALTDPPTSGGLVSPLRRSLPYSGDPLSLSRHFRVDNHDVPLLVWSVLMSLLDRGGRAGWESGEGESSRHLTAAAAGERL